MPRPLRLVAAGSLTLITTSVPNTPGIFFHGAETQMTTFGAGFLCTRGGLRRGSVVSASQNVATYVYNNAGPKRSLAPYIGTTRYFQYWFRDSNGGFGFNTSDGVAVAIQP